MVIASLLLLIAAAELEDGRGHKGKPDDWMVAHQPAPVPVSEETKEARRAARLRVGVGAGILGGFAYYQPSGGLGLTLDAGVMLRDRLALFVHGELGSLVTTLIGSVALVSEYAISDHLGMGGGVAFTAWTPLFQIGSARFTGLTFPVRLSYGFGARGVDATRRSGVMLSMQVAPGVTLIPENPFQQPGPQPAQPSITSTVSVGYAWW